MMELPSLPPAGIVDTRQFCHACARLAGGWTASCRKRRKHWWQLSLRPSLQGARTGLLQAGDVVFELALDLSNGRLQVEVAGGASYEGALTDNSPEQLAAEVSEFLIAQGVPADYWPVYPAEGHDSLNIGHGHAYAAEVAADFATVWRFIASAMDEFRAGIPEESSPIMLWPGHFDLAMMWLPGEKIPGQDPADEEYSDKQMNFGFSFGDEGIPEPYFFVTAYPTPEAFAQLELPSGAQWHKEGFSGAVLSYPELVRRADPRADLLELWNFLIDSGRQQMLTSGQGD